ncbi:MAG: hypothetical protein KDA75_00920 [Planctomycetaceae bacterium]|nr:hypothetical protein [Planctomycetaceae bacterium]
MTIRRHHVRSNDHRRPPQGERAGVRGCRRSARSGATLTEVLMSLLIMGLGITSVFTLFPMSILRSVKSTNLTHAALLAETARDFYVYQRELLNQPPDRLANPYYGYRDPLLDLTPVVPDNLIPQPFVGTFVVDPYGGINAQDFGNVPGRYGSDPGGALALPVGVLRVSNGITAPNLGVIASPDSWITVFDDVPANVRNITTPTVATEIDFTPDVDLTQAIAAGSRVLITSQNGRRSFTTGVDLTSTPRPTNNYTLRLNRTLPTNLFNPVASFNDVGTIRVQNFERRYTFLLTMHRDELGQTTGQCVVFFRREFGEAETVYSIRTVGPPNNPAIGIDTRNRKLTIQTAGTGSGRAPSPGEYLFGTWLSKPGNPVVNGRWYRIVGVEELPASAWETATSGPEYRVTLDRNWEGFTNPQNTPRAMLPGGVISVFDLTVAS